jgi:hypothetical protein
MKELGQDGGRSQQRQAEARECLDTEVVPAVVAVQQGQDRPGVDQPSSVLSLTLLYNA